MKVLFLQSAHYAHDDRVLYHQAATLQKSGIDVDVWGKERFATFQANDTDADVIIADTPRALWKAHNSKAKLIYDITEWYPSKKNLRVNPFLIIPKAILMCIASLWAGYRSDALIFGEYYKSYPFRFLFPNKPSIDLPYYPDLQYISALPPHNITQCCKVLYAGPLTKEKGYFRVLEVIDKVRTLCPSTQIQLDIITNNAPDNTTKETAIHYLPYLPFKAFCETITQYDLFLDLRNNDIENTRCLPIKLFYYMACGRPSVYTNLKAIREGVPEIGDCASLADSSSDIAQAISQYIQNPVLYYSHCQAALTLSQKKYNWDLIKTPFTQIVGKQITTYVHKR